MAVTGLFPILRTRDLGSLVGFYERALGGAVDYRFEDVYVAMTIGAATLGIGLERDVAPGDPIALWFYVDDVDASFAGFLAGGGSSEREPKDMPWGERVAQVRDVDGNLIYLAAAGRSDA